MRFGAQVRQAGGFLAALRRAEDIGAEVIQLFAQSNRQWRLPVRTDETFGAYREARLAGGIVSVTVCHAPYLINVISPDAVTRARSFDSLVANLRAATALGALGLVLHPGSHRGVSADTAEARIARCLVAALDQAQADDGMVCDLLLENTAGAGGTMGRSFGELAAILDAANGDPRVGVCLDTQHLWASGISFASQARADRMVRQLSREIGLERLRCIHVNDSKVPSGAGLDRHENLGAGTIGARRLGVLLGHPDLQGLPAILEVPGAQGDGAGAADLEVARSIHAAGLAARASSARLTAGRGQGRPSVPGTSLNVSGASAAPSGARRDRPDSSRSAGKRFGIC